MIEISNANDKPVQRFLGYFLRSVEKSAKLAKVYMRMFVDCSLRARHRPFFFVSLSHFFVTRRLNASYGNHMVTWEKRIVN